MNSHVDMVPGVPGEGQGAVRGSFYALGPTRTEVGMSRLLRTQYTLVYPDYGIFQIVDSGSEDRDAPLPGKQDFSAGERSVFLHSFQNNVLVRLDLESWTGEPPTLGGEWEGSDTATITLSSGAVDIAELTLGRQEAVLRLPAPGRYQVRVAHRNRRLVSKAYQALFGEDTDIHSAEFAAATRDLEGLEQYLAQFWAA